MASCEFEVPGIFVGLQRGATPPESTATTAPRPDAASADSRGLLPTRTIDPGVRVEALDLRAHLQPFSLSLLSWTF